MRGRAPRRTEVGQRISLERHTRKGEGSPVFPPKGRVPRTRLWRWIRWRAPSSRLLQDKKKVWKVINESQEGE